MRHGRRGGCPPRLDGPMDHGREFWARLNTQLTVEDVPVGFESAAAFDPVALGQMRLDQHALGALPQRFGSDGHHRCLHRLGAAADSGKLTAERLKRMEQPLPDAFAFDQRPIVIPSGQEINGIDPPWHDRQVLARC